MPTFMTYWKKFKLVTGTFERAQRFKVDPVSYESLEAGALMSTLVNGKLRRGVAEAGRDRREIADIISRRRKSMVGCKSRRPIRSARSRTYNAIHIGAQALTSELRSGSVTMRVYQP